MSLLNEKEDQDYLDIIQNARGGFNFDNCERNVQLCQKLLGKTKFPTAKKTGTTICGIVCREAGVVILGADTRATAGSIVADKNADKLHHITSNIQCAGAGTSADLTATTDLMARQMELHALNTGTQVRVCTVVQRLKTMLFKYQGHVGCALVLGGVDVTGPHLYQIYPHGSTDKLPYTTMGSGCLAAMSVLELGYKDGLTVKEGIQLVADAINSGTDNDLGSGNNVDVCVIYKDKKEHLRNYRSPYPRTYQGQYPSFKAGTTPLIAPDAVEWKKHVTVTDGEDASGDVLMTDA